MQFCFFFFFGFTCTQKTVRLYMLTCYICRRHYSFIRIGTFFFFFFSILCVSLTFELFFVSLSVFLPADGETHRIIYDAGVCIVHALHSSSVFPCTGRYSTQGKTVTTERENKHKKETTREVVAEFG